MAQEQAKVLREYFEADDQKKFYYEGIAGRGGQATICKIKFVKPGAAMSTARSLVVKVANPKRGSDVQGTLREKQILMELRGCKHIVRCIVGPNDPLEPAADERNWAWIYMDQIENGTLTGFMVRAKQKGMVRLPNRVLWPIFLCLIRACIAMAWPRNAEDLNESTARTRGKATGLAHNDIHGGNLLFGSYLDHPEHGRTPILKLIDFGLAGRIHEDDDDEFGTGEQRNILDIGIMMASVIGLMTDRKYTGEEIEVDLSPLNCQKTVISPASNLLEDVDMGTPDPFPLVDRDVKLIAAACMASDPEERPSLAELEAWVAERLLYDANKYGNKKFEQNDNIRRILQILIFDAF